MDKNNEKFAVLILAAGQGKRMESALPKPLTQLNGKPFIEWLVSSVEKSGITDKPFIVVSTDNQDQFGTALGARVRYVIQTEQLGTGHAVTVAQDALKKYANVLVLYGDHPTIPAEVLARLAATHEHSGAVLTFMTTVLDAFDGWKKIFFDFGRVKRDAKGEVMDIIERKGASDEDLKIQEVNSGLYCFKAAWLWEQLPKLRAENVQKEYYLTDLIKIAIDAGARVVAEPVEAKFCIGINTKEQLAMCEEALR
jgi:bifunctional UDP-N-acetylglucosamine pyrophosphorylase/glucosamine-1-phosphate N-acetyltransferase